MKVIFIENFGVSIGELVYPAADVSEQISTASKEASGTGNMKFMMNGAITLGTLDGANVEIREAVGNDHCVIFGLRAEEVMNYYAGGTYSAWDEYHANEKVRTVMNQLVDGTYGDFRSIYDYLLHANDEFFILKDFNAYDDARLEVMRRFKDKDGWARTAAMNVAHSGSRPTVRLMNMLGIFGISTPSSSRNSRFQIIFRRGFCENISVK